MAVGARPGAIAWSVGRHALRMTGGGAVAGTVLAFAGGGLLRSKVSSLASPSLSIALAGTVDEVRTRFAQRWTGVYERTLLWPPAFRGQEAVRCLIEAFRAPA